MFKGALENSETDYPTWWGYCRALLTKYHLYERLPFREWDKITWPIENCAIGPKVALAQMAYFDVRDLDRPIGYKENLVSLWQAARFWREGSAGVTLDVGADRADRINRPIAELRADDISIHPTLREWERLWAHLGPPGRFDSFLHRQKFEPLRRAAGRTP